MRKGEPTDGLAFYALLLADDGFCMALGRSVLAAGRLETVLKQYLDQHTPEEKATKATLGRLINLAEERQLLTRLVPALKVLRDQRNELTHNVHGLFAGRVEETILEASGLLDSDVDLFRYRAEQLRQELDAFADMVLEA